MPRQLAVGLFCAIVATGCDSSHLPSEVASSGVDTLLADETGIVAFNTERHLGLLKYDEQVAATFTILNSGRDVAHLSLGQPSCTCTSAALRELEIRPEATTVLEMKLDSRDSAGPFSASVVAAAKDRKWAQTFRVDAIAQGSRFNNDTIALDESEHTSDKLLGQVYCGYGVPKCDVKIVGIDEASQRELEAAIIVTDPIVRRVERGEAFGEFYVEVGVATKAPSSATLKQCQGRLQVRIQANGWEQVHKRDISFHQHGSRGDALASPAKESETEGESNRAR